MRMAGAGFECVFDMLPRCATRWDYSQFTQTPGVLDSSELVGWRYRIKSFAWRK